MTYEKPKVTVLSDEELMDIVTIGGSSSTNGNGNGSGITIGSGGSSGGGGCSPFCTRT